jgi:hypothetical protein
MLGRLTAFASVVLAVALAVDLIAGLAGGGPGHEGLRALVRNALRAAEFLVAGSPLLVLVRLGVALRVVEPRLARFAVGALVATVAGVAIAI